MRIRPFAPSLHRLVKEAFTALLVKVLHEVVELAAARRREESGVHGERATNEGENRGSGHDG